MGRRAVPGITPLLEQAKLTRIVCCRRSHARRDACPPFLAWLLIHIDDMHRFPNEFIASKGSLRQQTHQDVRIAPGAVGLAPDIVGQTSRSLASCALGVTGV